MTRRSGSSENPCPSSYAIVRPEHLNHHGSLFGGQLLKWVDEIAWIVASREYPGYRLVTRAMDDVQFRTPVRSGSILHFHVRRARQGRSSVGYEVTVHADGPSRARERPVFTTRVTFVSVDRQGRKRRLPPTATP
jgi:acyl-CoA hydrolase